MSQCLDMRSIVLDIYAKTSKLIRLKGQHNWKWFSLQMIYLKRDRVIFCDGWNNLLRLLHWVKSPSKEKNTVYWLISLYFYCSHIQHLYISRVCVYACVQVPWLHLNAQLHLHILCACKDTQRDLSSALCQLNSAAPSSWDSVIMEEAWGSGFP